MQNFAHRVLYSKYDNYIFNNNINISWFWLLLY